MYFSEICPKQTDYWEIRNAIGSKNERVKQCLNRISLQTVNWTTAFVIKPADIDTSANK